MEKAQPEIKIERLVHVDAALQIQINDLLDEDSEWDNTQGEKFLSNPDNALFLAFVNNKAVGFLTAYKLQRLDAKKAEVLLYEVGVLEEFQRQGIATKLIEAVKDWAAHVAADEVWVLAYASNLAAMALYKSVGWEEDPSGTSMFTFRA